ncbi:ABC transporter, ATP-binding protein [Thermodesulfovibrio sp. N1]|uniref:ABC transporter ATP-binding protein n=1 Tax=Thermodesulfovibrio sp. N1 TaxID=1871110 RepID=UPI00083B6075|nr:ABC transporter ATP-binding protein [Thermodesulfovibrio sp. N1]ODA43757.1 ABC transporter, ATP-binding protein [Thermodesulfovibrio sp. N1]
MIELKNIVKTYKRGAEIVYALKDINLKIEKGDFIAITGPSGSGKTTLLYIIGCLDKPSSGVMKFNDKDIGKMSEADLVKIRREKIGFIFQHFYLLPGLNVLENITLPLIFGRKTRSKEEIISLIESVGLKDRIYHRINQLSGGEMQRVAIARAIVSNPEILLADEPTGNLDTENSEKIFELLRLLNKKGLSVVMVTHNTELAKRTNKVITLRDGKIFY